MQGLRQDDCRVAIERQEDMEEMKFTIKGRAVSVRLAGDTLQKVRDGKVIESFGGFAPDKLKTMYNEMVTNTELEARNV
jgi:hypothetical protein